MPSETSPTSKVLTVMSVSLNPICTLVLIDAAVMLTSPAGSSRGSNCARYLLLDYRHGSRPLILALRN
jgi:hypothetical protein